MHSVRFAAARLVDQNFLSRVPEAQAKPFKEAVAQLPDYLTIELKESADADHTTDGWYELSAEAHLDQGLVNQSYRELADSRGMGKAFKPSFLNRLFPKLLNRRALKTRLNLMEEVLKSARSIQSDVEAWQAKHAPTKPASN